MGNGIYFKIARWVDLDISFKIVSDDAVHQPTWPLLLKLEHMEKLQILGNNSKMGYGIYFKIAWYADLDMLNMFAV
jgi:hypothetical protein